MTGAGAAELLGDRDAEKTHIGEALPQFTIVRLLAVKHRAHRLRRAFFGQKLAGLVAQLLLFVGEIEIHGAVPLLNCHSGARAKLANPESRCKEPLESGSVRKTD